MTQKIDQSTWATTSTPMTVDPCSWMPSSKSRIKLTQPSPSEDHAEKVSADLAPWTSMEDITWPASAQSQREIMKNQPSHHWWWCSCSRTCAPTWVISMPSTSQSTHSWRERPTRLRDKRSTSNQLRTESSLMDFMSVSSALAANQPAHLTGGIHRITWDQPFWCNPTDGLLIPEMSTLTRDLRRLVVIWNWENAIKSVSAHLLAQKASIQELLLLILRSSILTIIIEKKPKLPKFESEYDFCLTLHT